MPDKKEKNWKRNNCILLLIMEHNKYVARRTTKKSRKFNTII